jgi:deoxyribonuclease V
LATVAVFDHSWEVSPAGARAIQEQLRGLVETRDRLGPISRVAGVDVGFEEGGAITRAAVVVLDLPSLTLVESALARRPTQFPYIPGLLSFREIPAVLEAFDHLDAVPDVLLCDGQGIAHPRRFGIASHLGVIRDLPSIGVAKRRLTGMHAPVPDRRGAWRPLTEGDEVIGAVLRTRIGVKPLFISTGHRVSLETAIRIVLDCTPRYRLPETTRCAHRLASR